MNINIIEKKEFDSFTEDLLKRIDHILKKYNPTSFRLLKSGEVKELLKCSTGTIHNLKKSGQLPYIKIGGTIYYKLSDILDLIDNYKGGKNNDRYNTKRRAG